MAWLIKYISEKLARYVTENDDPEHFEVIAYGFDIWIQKILVIAAETSSSNVEEMLNIGIEGFISKFYTKQVTFEFSEKEKHIIECCHKWLSVEKVAFKK